MSTKNENDMETDGAAADQPTSNTSMDMDDASESKMNDLEIDKVQISSTQELEGVQFVLGVDFGTDSAVLALMPIRTVQAEILRNDLSNQKTPTAISFYDGQRAFGDLALQLLTAQKNNTLTGVLRAIGNTPRHFLENNPFFVARVTSENDEDDAGKCVFVVDFEGEEIKLRPEQVLAMFLTQFVHYAANSDVIGGLAALKGMGSELGDKRVNIGNTVVSMVVPECFNNDQIRAVKVACQIAGINCVETITRTAAAAVTYATKKTHDLVTNKIVLFVDIGHGYASFAVYRFSVSENELLKRKCAENLVTECDETLGSCMVDDAIYEELVKECKEKYKFKVEKSSKGAIRLRAACVRLKEALSGVPEASATCENLIEGQDIRFNFTRERLDGATAALKQQLQQRVGLVLDKLKAFDEPDKEAKIDIVELVGGGMRVPFVKDCIMEAIKSHEKDHVYELSYTLDALAANVIGACYNVIKRYEPTGAVRRPKFDNIAVLKDDFGIAPLEGVDLGISPEVLQTMRFLHDKMNSMDEDVKATSEARNELERFIFEMRGAANGTRNKKYAGLIKKDECLNALDVAEKWLYSEERESETKDSYSKIYEDLKIKLGESCGDYWSNIEKDERKREEELKELSKQAHEELEKAGGKDDHDFRKLPKEERMKKVKMNKDEGTSLFKDGNFEPASLRYKRALQHCDKFFDLNPEDRKEVDELRISLLMNLSLCEIKLEQYDFALKNLNEILSSKDNASNAKALYRRAVVYEKLKDFEKAKKDLVKAQTVEPEDKAVSKLLQSIELHLKKQKEKQKKMAQKMFA